MYLMGQWWQRRGENVEAFREMPGEILADLNDPDLALIQNQIRASSGDLDTTVKQLEESLPDVCVRFAVNRVLQAVAPALAAWRMQQGYRLEGEADQLRNPSQIEQLSPRSLLDLIQPLIDGHPGQLGVEFDDEKTDLMQPILALPAGVDPIDWAMENRKPQCALLAVRNAIGRGVPFNPDSIGSLILAIGVTQARTITIANAPHTLSISEVAFHERGIYVAAGFTAEVARYASFMWSGFDSIRDGLNAGYLMQDFTWGSGSSRQPGGKFGYFSGRRFQGDTLMLRANRPMVEIDHARPLPGNGRVFEIEPLEFEIPVAEILGALPDLTKPGDVS